MEKPKLTTVHASALETRPPFYFEGMTTRVFPLRARLFELQLFLDRYLNIGPPEVGRFRAFVPFVHLMILDYGRMAARAGNRAWVSQFEVLFSVPVEWYRREGGRYRFHDFASVSPFIYVDDQMSMTLGRESYGWPKTVAWLAPGLRSWIHDPRESLRDAAMSTMVFPEVYAGKRQEPRVFLEIEQAPPVSASLPFDLRNPLLPWTAIPRAIEGAASLMRDYADILAGIARRPGSSSGLDPFLEMARRAASGQSPWDPLTSFNTVNLKQFRGAAHPERFCYQALTNAVMRAESLRGGGLLGHVSTLLGGDVSGGFAVDLHQWGSQPIVQTLGLEVEERWRGDGVDVARLRPVLPFWYEVDMEYDVGKNLAWRGQGHEGRRCDRAWHFELGDDDSAGPVCDLHETRLHPHEEELDAAAEPYNAALGASAQAVAGPFLFPRTTLRVLPLLAERKALEALLDGYNKELSGASARFELWPPSDPKAEAPDPYRYVYLVVTKYEEMSSETNDIGWWAERELTFCVPVQWTEKGQLVGVGLLPVYSYANSATAAISRSEIAGIPTIKADITSPPNTPWMESESPSATAVRPLLTVTTELLAALDEGQQAAQAVVLEIQSGHAVAPGDKASWRFMGERWGPALKSELRRKTRVAETHTPDFRAALALSLEVLVNEVPLSFYTLKQFRDIEEPDRACYQSVVRLQRSIVDLYEIREIEEPLQVRIRSFASQPIVKTLGLVATVSRDEHGIVHSLQPVRPFWVKASLREELGQELLSRSGSTEWQRGSGDPRWYLKDESPRVGIGVLQDLMVQPPRRLKKLLREHAEGKRPAPGLLDGPAPGAPINAESARAAVRRIDPQMILEAILSLEWESWDDDARWRKARAEQTRRLGASQVGVSGERRLTRRAQLLRDEYRRNRQNTGTAFAGLFSAQKMLGFFDAFVEESDGASLLEAAHDKVSTECETLVRASEHGREVAHGYELPIAAQRFHETVHEFLGAAFHATIEWRHWSLPWTASTWEERRLTALHDNEVARWCREMLDEGKGWPDEATQLVVEECRARVEQSAGIIATLLAKLQQKPVFCLPRASVGSIADDLFPLDECWEGTWYYWDPATLYQQVPGASLGFVPGADEPAAIEGVDAEPAPPVLHLSADGVVTFPDRSVLVKSPAGDPIAGAPVTFGCDGPEGMTIQLTPGGRRTLVVETGLDGIATLRSLDGRSMRVAEQAPLKAPGEGEQMLLLEPEPTSVFHVGLVTVTARYGEMTVTSAFQVADPEPAAKTEQASK